MAFAQRTFADWVGMLTEHKRSSRTLVGPCPTCGGDDRFHVTQTRDGRVLVGCRGCIDGQTSSVRREQFQKIVRIVFGDAPKPDAFTPPKPAPAPKPPKRGPLAERLWDAGLKPKAVAVRAYLARRRIWPNAAEAILLPDESLRWLPAASLRRLLPQPLQDDGSRRCPLPESAAGCLAFAFRTEEGRLTAVSLEGLMSDGGFPPEGRFRRTYGRREGSFFAPRRSSGNETIVVCEGEMDALAAVAMGHGRGNGFAGAEVRAYGGTANLASAALPGERRVIVVTDGDDAGWGSALRLCQRHPDAQVEWTPRGTDLAQILAEDIEERASIHRDAGGLEKYEAEMLAWKSAGLLRADPTNQEGEKT